MFWKTLMVKISTATWWLLIATAVLGSTFPLTSFRFVRGFLCGVAITALVMSYASSSSHRISDFDSIRFGGSKHNVLMQADIVIALYEDLKKTCGYLGFLYGKSLEGWCCEWYAQWLRVACSTIISFVKCHLLLDLEEEGLLSSDDGGSRHVGINVLAHAGAEDVLELDDYRSSSNQDEEGDTACDLSPIESSSTQAEEGHEAVQAQVCSGCALTLEFCAACFCASPSEMTSVDKHQILSPQGISDATHKRNVWRSLDVPAELVNSELQKTADDCLFTTKEDKLQLQILNAKMQQGSDPVLYGKKEYMIGGKLYGGDDENCLISVDNIHLDAFNTETGDSSISVLPSISKALDLMMHSHVYEQSVVSSKFHGPVEATNIFNHEQDAWTDKGSIEPIDVAGHVLMCAQGSKGDESNYFSSKGSFRELVDSSEEMADTRGCCEDEVKPCIQHCRSRSKVLQSGPLLSKRCLKNELQPMDVLWQEYYENQCRARWSKAFEKACIRHQIKLKEEAHAGLVGDNEADFGSNGHCNRTRRKCFFRLCTSVRVGFQKLCSKLNAH